MDKDLATRVLAEELVNQGKFYVVDSATLAFYTSNSIYSVPVFKGKDLIEETHSYSPVTRAKELKANYLFVTRTRETYRHTTKTFDIISPFAIIGKEEARQINEVLYKEMPEKVAKALKVLEQPNYNELYNDYLRGQLKQYEIGIGDIIQGKKTGLYYKIESIKNGQYCGPRYYDMNLSRLENKDADCDFDKAILVKGKHKAPIEFLNFIFSLPEEEQNIEENKKILREEKELDINGIFSRLYKNNAVERFKEYFEIIPTDSQNEAVDYVKNFEAKNLTINSWLFEKGHKIPLSHLELYKNHNVAVFKGYFETLSIENQIQVVNDILGSGEKDEVIDKFLSENHAAVVDLAGRDRCYGS